MSIYRGAYIVALGLTAAVSLLVKGEWGVVAALGLLYVVTARLIP